MTQSENTVLLFGFVALVVLFLTRGAGRQRPVITGTGEAAPDSPDVWTTPFYLRSNMPIATSSQAVMPNNRYAAWSLGIPQPSAQRGSGYGL